MSKMGKKKRLRAYCNPILRWLTYPSLVCLPVPRNLAWVQCLRKVVHSLDFDLLGFQVSLGLSLEHLLGRSAECLVNQFPCIIIHSGSKPCINKKRHHLEVRVSLLNPCQTVSSNNRKQCNQRVMLSSGQLSISVVK